MVISITESFEYQYRYQYIANCLPVGEADIMVISITESFEYQNRYQYIAKICFYTNLPK